MKRIWVDRDKCLGCRTCELRCAVERDSVSKTLLGAVREEHRPAARVMVSGRTGEAFPIQCRHCEDAVCIRVCPAGAMQRNPETGTVFVDRSRCRGCWMCVMACPFGAVQPAAEFKTALKCDACADMEEPACAASCPTGALVYGDEESFAEILAARRGQLAIYARTAPLPAGSSIVSIEALRKGDGE